MKQSTYENLRETGRPNGRIKSMKQDLIAAAPEMLEALKALLRGNLNQTEVSGEGGYLTVSGDLMRKTKAIIAKAEGKED